MFEQQSSETKQAPVIVMDDEPNADSSMIKKFAKIAIIAVVILVLGGAIFYFAMQPKKQPKPVEKVWVAPPVTGPTEVSSQLNTSTNQEEVKPGNFLIEQVSFQNFYQAPAGGFQPAINDYTLPIKVKTDVVNYYKISRKLNLDPALTSLSQNGFAILDNPDPKNNQDFYSSYAWLKTKGLPIVLSTDFINYYYQNSVKSSFKYLEENLFYESLWGISKELFNTARLRYETRREKLGDTNDQVLEGERLELAFFAVAMQLLQPQAGQMVDGKGKASEQFTAEEAKDLTFSLPEYLKDDVDREMALIRGASENVKSPVLLYKRDYKEFRVPAQYSHNPRWNNFYLAAKWFNSVFPLYYQSKDCPTCQLDDNDWQVNLTAASFIAHDFYDNYQVKNQWARIYKTIAFFKGLREDFTYFDYQKTLVEVFGPDYDLETLLDDQNPEAVANFNRLRAALLAINFPEWGGGYDRNDLAIRPKIGFRILAEFYSANDFIKHGLTAPKIGPYTGKGKKVASLCGYSTRCNLLPLDIVNLIFSFPDPAWMENTEYQGFLEKFLELKKMINNFSSWQFSNYWSNLKVFKDYLNNNPNNLPIFGRNEAWKKREVAAVQSFWANLQSPPDSFKVVETKPSLGQGVALDGVDYYYIEPNLALIDELIADRQMILGMYKALEINIEAPKAIEGLEAIGKDLETLRALMVKELSGEQLSVEDAVWLSDFVGRQSLSVKNSYPGIPKFLILIFKTGDQKALTVGPIF